MKPITKSHKDRAEDRANIPMPGFTREAIKKLISPSIDTGSKRARKAKHIMKKQKIRSTVALVLCSDIALLKISSAFTTPGSSNSILSSLPVP